MSNFVIHADKKIMKELSTQEVRCLSLANRLVLLGNEAINIWREKMNLIKNKTYDKI